MKLGKIVTFYLLIFCVLMSFYQTRMVEQIICQKTKKNNLLKKIWNGTLKITCILQYHVQLNLNSFKKGSVSELKPASQSK